MSGLIESAGAILAHAERRVVIIANNVANLTTPGFKQQLSFIEALGPDDSRSAGSLRPGVHTDFAQGRMIRSDNPLDLAIAGEGFFRLRAGDAIVYSRQGQFSLAEDGTVLDADGRALQQAGGGDLVLERAEVEILADGTVLDEGRPLGRIGLFAPAAAAVAEPLAGSLFAIADDAVEEVRAPDLRQGMVEASNVSLGDEMVAMMASLRHAETGARLVQLYDELTGRAITTFGQAGR